jgi:hypothetical protein
VFPYQVGLPLPITIRINNAVWLCTRPTTLFYTPETSHPICPSLISPPDQQGVNSPSNPPKNDLNPQMKSASQNVNDFPRVTRASKCILQSPYKTRFYALSLFLFGTTTPKYMPSANPMIARMRRNTPRDHHLSFLARRADLIPASSCTFAASVSCLTCSVCCSICCTAVSWYVTTSFSCVNRSANSPNVCSIRWMSLWRARTAPSTLEACPLRLLLSC